MDNEELIGKVTQTLVRDDGSECRIVVTDMGGPFSLTPQIDVYVLRRATPEDRWSLCSNRPHPDWKQMPRQDYLDFGRSEMLQTVSHAEILKLTQLIGQPMTAMESIQ